MPVVAGPQGSRSGLITAVAIFTILFVVATIFAIYFGVKVNQVTLEFDHYRASSEAVTLNPTSPEIADLASDNYFAPRGKPALDVSVARTAALVKVINGNTIVAGQPTAGAPQQAVVDAANAEAAAKQSVGDSATFPTDGSNLVSVISALANEIVNLKGQNTQLTQDRDAVKTDAAGQIAAAGTSTTEKQKDIDSATADKQKAMDDAAAAEKDYQDKIDAMTQQMAAEQANDKANSDAVQVKLSDSESKLAADQKLIESLTNKLANIRVSVEDPVIDRPEGQIVSAPNSQVCYINLGQGDQISAGMTFEVYDKSLPLPKLGDGTSDENLPVGKGSIEVTQVGSSTSQCQIVHLEPGQNFVEGDKILNIVYDRNTKYNFVVYGDFDLANTGKATPQDTEVIKRLITQWGGKLQTTAINADTDFVVLGKEPDVPVFSKEELEDPFNAKQYADALAADNAYQAVKDKASDLHIPVMNQNRFLYFVGYYDLATR